MLSDFVKRHAANGVVHVIDDLVHGQDQAARVAALQGRDKGAVQQRHGLVGDVVGLMLQFLDLPGLFLGVVEAFESAAKLLGAADKDFGVTVEIGEKLGVAGQEIEHGKPSGR